MNNLSWFLYLVDIIPRVSGLFGGLGFVALGASIILTLGYFISLTEPDETRKSYLSFYKATMYVLTPLLILGFFSMFVPSRDTMYLIAGSELGEEVVQTPEAQEILDSVHEVIKYQLEELKGNSNGD